MLYRMSINKVCIRTEVLRDSGELSPTKFLAGDPVGMGVAADYLLVPTYLIGVAFAYFLVTFDVSVSVVIDVDFFCTRGFNNHVFFFGCTFKRTEKPLCLMLYQTSQKLQKKGLLHMYIAIAIWDEIELRVFGVRLVLSMLKNADIK